VGSGDFRPRPSKARRVCVGLGFVAALAAAGLAVAPASADYTDGVMAANKISMEAAIRIWRRDGWQNDDFLAQIKLGDIYGDERGDNKFYDPVESYVWYYLASVSDRIHEHIEDLYARRVIANDYHRALSEQQKLMLLLNAEQREQARNRIVYILATRGADDHIRHRCIRAGRRLRRSPGRKPGDLWRAGGCLALRTCVPGACQAGIRIW
jgi:hypothetical protein